MAEYHIPDAGKMFPTLSLAPGKWLGLFFLLASCSTPTLKPICPQIVPWSLDFQHQAGAEIRANPGLVALPEIARQDLGLRAQVRVCQKAAQ